MAAMAGGCGISFEKPGVYTIGNGENPLETGGGEIVRAVRVGYTVVCRSSRGTLILLAWLINSTGI